MGWVPALAAAGGGLLLALRDRGRALLLLPGPLLFILFMGLQERYFGRWLLPVFPVVAVIAAYGALAAADALGARRAAWRRPALALAAVALLAQGVVHSVHNDAVLSRDDTRNLAREWMVANLPYRAHVVVEPMAPDAWAQDERRPQPALYRFIKWPTSRSAVDFQGRPLPEGAAQRIVNIEDYERILRPALIDAYIAGRYCWVVVGSTQRGRAEAEPKRVPRAIAYYRELERRGRVVARFSPYDEGAGAVAFNFDWSFDFYPLAYGRPGPEVTIYRLTEGRCS